MTIGPLMKDTTLKEIRVRLATAKSITSDLVYIWKDDDISISLKKRCVYSLGWSEAQYGNESWTLKKEDEKRVHAFEIWVWLKMLRISWTQRKRNICVWGKVGVMEEEGLLY